MEGDASALQFVDRVSSKVVWVCISVVASVPGVVESWSSKTSDAGGDSTLISTNSLSLWPLLGCTISSAHSIFASSSEVNSSKYIISNISNRLLDSIGYKLNYRKYQQTLQSGVDVNSQFGNLQIQLCLNNLKFCFKVFL